mmetsp:Transcript_14254/g.44822  ORF Transcript_14254/g.44822 Transcript_14254/m.44822 type:complete len:994 (+) Transcript_14254:82-3063(+)
MYLGQEKWARTPGAFTAPGGQPGVQSQQFPRTFQQLQQRPQVSLPPSRTEVGDATGITVSGCVHGVVGPIVCGNYTLTTTNHGRPVYRKDPQPGKPEVMLYFWDERDGVGSSGWWLSPKVGSEVVWGFHPSRASQTPPTTGWKVPYDAGVDPNFLITVRRGMPQQQLPQQQHHPLQSQHQRPLLGAGMARPMQVAMPANGFADQQREAREREAKKQLELKRQQEEFNRKRLEEQRKRMEEVRKEQEEANMKRKEEQQRRVEAMKKQQEAIRGEQRAVSAIRQVLQKVRFVQPDQGLDDLEAELQATLDKELPNCGGQQTAISEESKKCLEQAKQRIALIKEQRQKEEERRVEEERKRKEAQEKADKLLTELEELVGVAEAALTRLREAVDAFKETSPATTADIAAAADSIATLGDEARKAVGACTDFVASNGADIRKGAPPGQERRDRRGAKRSQAGEMAPKGEANKDDKPAEGKPGLGRLHHRISKCERVVESLLKSAKAAREAAERKVAAKVEVSKQEDAFRKYDKDKDGMLSRQEIVQYAEGECKFKMPKEALDFIFKVFVDAEKKGVKAEDFYRLRIAVGLAREKEIDTKRRERRLERERQLAEAKKELQGRLKEIASAVEATAQAVLKVEEQMKQAPNQSPAMLEHASTMDGLTKEAKDSIVAVRERIHGLSGEEIDPELASFLREECQKLENQTVSFDNRLTKASAWLKRFRGEAKKLASQELEDMQVKALAVLRQHQRTKGLKSEELFGEFDSNGDGRIDESEFQEFFNKCEKAAEDEPAGEEDKEAETPAKLGPLLEGLPRLFAFLDEEGEKAIQPEVFARFARHYMKVIKDTVITGGLSIKDSKVVRRIEHKEVVEVLEIPKKEGDVGVMRVRAKAMSDGAEGWITIEGNQKSKYLEEGGGVFRVVKDTIITDSFLLGAPKEVTRKLFDTTRKLAAGDLVEVREWPKLEESSGLTRMKCRVKADGHIGWVTTVGNQGAVFLEVA